MSLLVQYGQYLKWIKYKCYKFYHGGWYQYLATFLLQQKYSQLTFLLCSIFNNLKHFWFCFTITQPWTFKLSALRLPWYWDRQMLWYGVVHHAEERNNWLRAPAHYSLHNMPHHVFVRPLARFAVFNLFFKPTDSLLSRCLLHTRSSGWSASTHSHKMWLHWGSQQEVGLTKVQVDNWALTFFVCALVCGCCPLAMVS